MWWLVLVFVFIPMAVVFALLMLAVGAVAVVVAAVDAMPWLLILAGLWLLVRMQRGPGHGRRAAAPARWRPGTGQAPRAGPARPARHDPPRPAPRASQPARELPIDVQVKVEQIRRKADVLLGYADRFPPFSRDLHVVRQTAAEYLPRTIEAYLALPGDDDPVVVAATAKTALQELTEQLRILDSKLDDVAHDLQRQDLARLLANRRFLEERFGARPIDAPDTTHHAMLA